MVEKQDKPLKWWMRRAALVGDAWRRDGQEYICIELTRGVNRKTNAPFRASLWKTKCAEPGCETVFVESYRFNFPCNQGLPIRRCPAHRRKGVRVDGRRLRRPVDPALLGVARTALQLTSAGLSADQIRGCMVAAGVFGRKRERKQIDLCDRVLYDMQHSRTAEATRLADGSTTIWRLRK